MAQIETREGVRNAEAIAAVDGIDVLFIGPPDLTTNLGVPSQYDRASYLDALKMVAAAAANAGKAAGILLPAREHLPFCRGLGLSVIAFGSDGSAASTGLRAHARDLGE